MQPFIIALVILVVVLTIKGLRIVRQAEVVIVERLGRFNSILEPGVNIIWPFIDRPRLVQWRDTSGKTKGPRLVMAPSIDMREQVFDFPEQSVITSDNVVISVNGLLYYQVTDPMRVAYEVASLPTAIEKLAQTTLRNIIGEMELDTTLSSRDVINGKMRTVLDEATDKWGVKVNRVELQDISPPVTVQEAMEKQMRAERDKRAAILDAEADKQSKILRAEGERDSDIAEAEGERQARILRAKGEAEGLEIVREALEDIDANAAQYQVALNYLKTLESVAANGRGDKTVFLPFETANILGGIGSVTELINSASSKPEGENPPPLPR
jgi:regulator of protease activity HflC (stomatin/prohibitin superfamily)